MANKKKQSHREPPEPFMLVIDGLPLVVRQQFYEGVYVPVNTDVRREMSDCEFMSEPMGMYLEILTTIDKNKTFTTIGVRPEDLNDFVVHRVTLGGIDDAKVNKTGIIAPMSWVKSRQSRQDAIGAVQDALSAGERARRIILGLSAT